MNRLLWWILLAAILIQRGLTVPTITENPEDDDDDFDDEDEDSSEADDDGRIYKNPRNSPSTECPRDEEQATLLGQKCLRKCSSDEDCKSKKKKCLCDGACGMSCIKPDRECPELPKPPLGDVAVPDRHFGKRATYHCPHGYHVVGLQSRLCQADGQWAGQEPTCKENIYCLTPPLVEHARHSALPEQATFDLDSTVQYHCHTGYVTNGFPRAKCLAIDGQASWYGPDIQCEPRSCGQPGDPNNGYHSGECYNFGCRVVYHCGEGYELVGKPERYCQADGAWTPKELPICVLVTSVICPVPENPKNGKAIYTTFSYNSVVSYECKYGYMLVGESSRRCGADRKWSGMLPSCKEINCGHPGVLYNGWIENIQSGTGLGASIIFRCHSEMLLEGNASSICLIDGKWSHPMPQCLAPCIVPTISQGQVIPIEIEVDVNGTTTMAPVITPVGKVRHGTQLEVICDINYEFPASTLTAPTCNNGTWSVIPRCIPARCKSMPRAPKHGMVLAPKTEHGMKARFKCKDGFNLTGPGGKEVANLNDYVLTCSFGNWTGETPFCQEVYCAFPGFVENGKVLLVGNMGLYDYRPYVKKIVNNKQIMYDCDKGFILEEGPPGATCVGGRWRPTELPKCIPGQHPRLRFNRRRRSIEMRYRRSKFIMEEARRLRKFIEENGIELSPNRKREKKAFFGFPFSARFLQKRARFHPLLRSKRKTAHSNDYPYKSMADLNDAVFRARREPDEMQRAYSKFYEKLKQKYQSYVKNLLGSHKTRNGEAGSKTSSPASRILSHNNNPTKKIQVQDGRWYNTYNSPDFVTRYKVTHKTSIANNDLNSDEENYLASYNELNVPSSDPRLDSVQLKKPDEIELITDTVSKFGDSSRSSIQTDRLRNMASVPNSSEGYSEARNLTKLIAQLKSQIVRRKRSTDKEDRKSAAEARRATRDPTRTRVPCDAIDVETFSNITVLRQGKSSEFNSPGTILHLLCNPGLKLNVKNQNATVRCVRGIWKPQRPACLSAPCSVPAAEHGRYYQVQSEDPLMATNKANWRALVPFEEVGDEQIITLQCDQGFHVQGPAQLRCIQSNWAVATFPECIPVPCVLPSLPNVIYEGGYRAGLNVAHGSSVTVHCDNPANSSPIQMVCNQGVMTPPSIHCETGSRRSREEYLGEAEFTSNDNALLELLNHAANTNSHLNAVVVNGEGSNELNGSGHDCGPPNRLETALVYKNIDTFDIEEGFPHGTEITFNCIASVAGERNTWKIICEDGQWIGRSWSCANGTCLFRNNEPNVVSFYNDLEIREETVDFPPGATIISRCSDIGKYAMVGSSVRTCIHSEWSGQKPACFGLNQENDYAMEKAPTVLFRHQNGPIAQSNDGKLIVYPGTTLHMECLWMRRFGNPKWNVSHDYRVYPEGWVAEEGRDAQLEYRLSIFHAVEDDSGVFTCQTPARHEHSVEVVVKAINCPEIPIRRGLMLSHNDTKLSSRVQLSCSNGNSLIGASELVCMPGGNWSAPLPVCESVECGDLPLPMNATSPRVAVLSREVGGRASFSCPTGYGLRGPTESICLPSGEWGTPFPTCVEVQCDNPGAPQNGYAQGSAPYRAGDVVQFNCNPEYMMQGQPIIACQDNGRWSGGLPKCVQACSYPGTAISGRMSSVKFYYAIGESITFTCDAGLELRGAKMLKCLRNGKWSNAIPTCVNNQNEHQQQTSRGSGHSG